MSGSRWACWVALPLALLLWAGIALVVQTPLLPTPAAVLETFWQALQSGELPEHLLVTLRRVLIAFALAMALGTLLGVWMGRSRLANALLDPLLVLFLNLPALVTIILLYVWFGLVEAAAVLAVVVNKVPNVAVTVREGAQPRPQARADGADLRLRPLAAHRPRLAAAAVPYLMAATRGGLALIWKIVLVVELLGRSDGIGFQLHMAFQVFDVASILAYSLAFIAVVQLIELALLQPLERRASAWREAGVRHA